MNFLTRLFHRRCKDKQEALARARRRVGNVGAYPLPQRPAVAIPRYRVAPVNGRYEVLCERDL